MNTKVIEEEDLWGERGEYWQKKMNPVPQYKARKRRILHKPLVLSGHGIKLRRFNSEVHNLEAI